MRRSVVVLLLVGVLSIAPAQSAFADGVTFEETFPLAGQVLDNPCPGGEPFLVTQGDVQHVDTVTYDSNNGAHVDSKNSFQGVRGVGTVSGVNYIVNSQDSSSSYDGAPLPIVSTESFTFVVVSAGGLPTNFLMRFVFHSTISSSGAVTTMDRPMLQCQGQ